MIKQTITYTDFNDNQHTEDFYFHLSKSELIKLETKHGIIKGDAYSGGFRELLQNVIDSGDGGEIIKIFEDVIALSYGRRSDDGKRFEKSDAIMEEFKSSAAYDEFFMSIVTDADKAAQFVNGIVPADIAKSLAEQDKPTGPPVVYTADTTEDDQLQPPGITGAPHVEKESPISMGDSPSLTPEEIAEVMRKRNEQ